MLNYGEFKYKLKVDLVDFGGAEIFVFDKVYTNNELSECIFVRGAMKNISPTLYLKPLFERYLTTGDYDEVLELIISYKDDILPENDIETMLNVIYSREDVLGRVTLRLINYEWNEELLQRLPYRRFEDLAVIYAITLDSDSVRNYSVRVTHDFLCKHEMTEIELWEHAYNNTLKFLKVDITSLDNIMCSINPEMFSEENTQMFFNYMYVVTSKMPHAAAAMLYPELFENIGDELESNFYVLPSSVHDLILLPTDNIKSWQIEQLQQIVYEVNQTAVDTRDRLSNSVYFYDRDLNTITKVSDYDVI